MKKQSKKNLPYRVSGSWIAAVLGQSNFNTPMDAFFYMAHGITKDRSDAELFQMKMGLRLERTVAELYKEYVESRGVKIKLKKPKPEKIIVDDWRALSPDFFVIGKPEPELMECKTGRYMSRSKWGVAGSDYVPTDYLFQVTWYNGHCRELFGKNGYTHSDIAVLFGNEDFRVYPITFEQELFDLMLEGAERFWKKHVITKTPPAPDGSKLFSEHLQERFKRFKKSYLLPANDEQIEWSIRLRDLDLNLKEIETERESLRQRLALSIGDAEGFVWSDENGSLNEVTWKPIQQTDWKSVAINACGDQRLLDDLILQNCQPSWAKIAKHLNPNQELISLYKTDGERRLKLKFTEQ